MDSTLSKTPLHDVHVGLGAKMVPFAGFSMPVQYPTGIRAEHAAVRENVGMFDVSHMGEFLVRGPQAAEFIQYLTVNDVTKIEVGQAQYSALCNHDGKIIDDLLVYRFEDKYLLVVNGSNRAKDWAWVTSHASDFDIQLTDESDDWALIAVQGPAVQGVLQPLTDTPLDPIGYYRAVEGTIASVTGIISRTGYTGEDGFELYVPASGAVTVWNAVQEAGESAGLIPTGLGCRDSLRLEMGYALYGNDLDEEHTALEAGLAWITKLDCGDFLGREALAAQKEAGVEIRLTGLKLTRRGFPRPGYPIVHEGRDVGVVTSGVLSPSVGSGIAMGYVPVALAKAGTELGIRIRDQIVPGVTQRPQFYSEGSIRR